LCIVRRASSDRPTSKLSQLHCNIHTPNSCYAFGQSVKLSVFEESVESSIERNKTIPEQMMRTGQLPRAMTNQRVAQYMGDLFVYEKNL
ncbi:unnamed protein product, partial [Amoebophrya sp. A25]